MFPGSASYLFPGRAGRLIDIRRTQLISSTEYCVRYNFSAHGNLQISRRGLCECSSKCLGIPAGLLIPSSAIYCHGFRTAMNCALRTTTPSLKTAHSQIAGPSFADMVDPYLYLTARLSASGMCQKSPTDANASCVVQATRSKTLVDLWSSAFFFIGFLPVLSPFHSAACQTHQDETARQGFKHFFIAREFSLEPRPN